MLLQYCAILVCPCLLTIRMNFIIYNQSDYRHCGLCLNAALAWSVSFPGQSNVPVHTPGVSPAVLALIKWRWCFSESCQQNSVIVLNSASTVENSSFVKSEPIFIGPNPDCDRLVGGCVEQLSLVVGLNDGAASHAISLETWLILTNLIFGSVWVIVVQGNAIVNYVLKGILGQTSSTAVVTVLSAAVHQLLLAEVKQFGVYNRIERLHCSCCSEGPAASTLPLIFNFCNNFSPVQGSRRRDGPYDSITSSCDIQSIFPNRSGQIAFSKLFVGEVCKHVGLHIELRLPLLEFLVLRVNVFKIIFKDFPSEAHFPQSVLFAVLTCPG